MDHDSPRDPLERNIRLGCGAAAGLLAGLSIGFFTLGLTVGWLWAFALPLAAAFAWAAVRFGDRFWVALLKFLRTVA